MLGLLSVAFNISLPETIDKTVSDIAAVATPLALIVLGASVTFDSIKGCSRNLIICIIARLVVVPALCLGTAALIGIRGVDFVSLIGLLHRRVRFRHSQWLSKWTATSNLRVRRLCSLRF